MSEFDTGSRSPSGQHLQRRVRELKPDQAKRSKLYTATVSALLAAADAEGMSAEEQLRRITEHLQAFLEGPRTGVRDTVTGAAIPGDVPLWRFVEDGLRHAHEAQNAALSRGLNGEDAAKEALYCLFRHADADMERAAHTIALDGNAPKDLRDEAFAVAAANADNAARAPVYRNRRVGESNDEWFDERMAAITEALADGTVTTSDTASRAISSLSRQADADPEEAWKRRTPEDERILAPDDTQSAALVNLEVQALTARLNRLPEKTRAILLLDAAGNSNADIAQRMNMTPDAVKKQLYRARKGLREEFDAA
jgi:hypothetical protein